VREYKHVGFMNYSLQHAGLGHARVLQLSLELGLLKLWSLSERVHARGAERSKD
jgi:hypothetical protein